MLEKIKQTTKQVGQIVEGHVNELLNKEDELSEKRLQICYNCPLYSVKLGDQCNPNLWLNIENGDVSLINKPGYVRGCGCRLQAKTRVPSAHCPAGKW